LDTTSSEFGSPRLEPAPDPLPPDWWLPILDADDRGRAPFPPCADRQYIAPNEKKTFGRTNNLIIEFVHLLALVELSRPRRAVVIPKKMASMPFDLAGATSSWTCAFEQPPRNVSATIVEASEAYFVQPANLGRAR
jgi:hypothetical protein